MNKFSVLVLSVIFAFSPMTAFADDLTVEEESTDVATQEVVTIAPGESKNTFKNFNLELGDKIEVDGDYGYGIYFGGTVVVNGSYDTGLTVIADNVIIDSATIDGTLTVYASKKIELKNGTKIVRLNYNSNVEVVKDEDVIVTEAGSYTIGAYNFSKKLSRGLRSLAGAIIMLLIIVLISKRFSTKMGERIDKYDFSGVVVDSLKGLVAIISIAIISLLLLMTGIGAPAGLIILALGSCMLYLSKIVFAIFLGKKLFKNQNTIIGATIVLIMVMVVGLIPRVGSVLGAIIILVGYGLSFKLLPEKVSKNIKENSKGAEKKMIKKAKK